MRISRWVEEDNLNYHPSVGAGKGGQKVLSNCVWLAPLRLSYVGRGRDHR